MLSKFMQELLANYKSYFFGGRSYTKWQHQTTSLFSVPLKNKKLAKELEEACKKDGFLTYSEFLQISQFGTHGYHLNHSYNGMTKVAEAWPKALVELSKKTGLTDIVEFGPGKGALGIATLHEAHKQHLSLSWSGIEINPHLQKTIRKDFAQEHLTSNLEQLVTTIQEFTFSQKCLFILAYSLDNIAPEVFINTQDNTAPPNTLLGVSVTNGILSEKSLTPDMLQEKGITFTNGIYTSYGYAWDTTEWKLFPMQRAYLPLAGLQQLTEIVKLLPTGSHVLIMDEFRPDNTIDGTFHLGTPCDLHTVTRYCDDLHHFYRFAGEALLYYPNYISVVTTMLHHLGFAEVQQENETHMIALLEHKDKTPLPRIALTYALLTSPKKKNPSKKLFKIPFPYDSIETSL